MSELITSLNEFVAVLFSTLDLFFDLLFNKLTFFGIGVGWYALVFTILNIVIFGVLGGVHDD